MVAGYALYGYAPSLDVSLLFYIEAAPPFLFGPLIYLWLCESVSPSPSLTYFLRYASIHCVLFLCLITFIALGLIRKPFDFIYFRVLLIIHVLTYIGFSLVKLWLHQKTLKSDYADLPFFRILPGFTVMLVFAAIWVITAINLLQMPRPEVLDFSIYQLFALQSGYILIISIFLVFGPDLFLPSQTFMLARGVSLAGDDVEVKTERVTETAGVQISLTLNRLMEDQQTFRDPDISLPCLAQQLGVSVHNLSEVINKVDGKSFYEYINARRVEYAKLRLSDRSNQQIKIHQVWSEAGFNNRTSFNAAFKKLTGETPSAFRKRVTS